MPDNIDDNKRLVVEFCEAYSRGDWAAIEGMCGEDFRWRAPTSQRRQSVVLRDAPRLNADPGWTRSEMLAIFEHTKAACVDRVFDLTPTSLTAEADRVAVEGVGRAVRIDNGRAYDNHYHHLFVCRDGLLVELREYQDTLHAFDVWMAP